MATIAKVQEDGIDLFNLNDGSTADLLGYFPDSAVVTDAARYDLITPLRDLARVSVRGSTRDICANNVSSIEEKCSRIGRRPLASYRVVWKRDGFTQEGNSNLRAATVRRVDEVTADIAGVYRQTIELQFLRDPFWEGALTTVTLDASSPIMTNDTTGYFVLPALLGDLPAACKIRITTSGGNSANVKKVMAGLKTWDAATFNHVLQFESAASLDGALTNLASTNYSPGTAGTTAKSWNPTSGNTSFRALARWDITANLSSYAGTFLVLLRVSDNAAVPNYRFRVRGGDIIGSTRQFGAWATPDRVITPASTAGATTEFLLMSLGAVTFPRVMRRFMPVNGICLQLWGEALAASAGAAYLDNLFLLPVNYCTRGAQFDMDVGSNVIVLDSRVGFPAAYLETVGSFYLTAAAQVTEGGGLFLYPRVALQRVYVILTRSESEFFRHARVNALTASVSYVPRWVNLPATI